MSNTFYLAPGEEFTNCPYNESHRITTAKEVTHVTKCRQNYLKECEEKGIRPDKVACRYVFSHQIPRQEREFHEERCPGAGRYSIASHIAYHGTEEFRDKVKQEQPEKLSDVSSDEHEAPPSRSKKSKSPKPKVKTEPGVRVKQEPIDDSPPPRNLDRFGRDAKRSAKGSKSKSPSRDRSRSPRERRRKSRDRERDRKRDRDRSRSRDRKSHRDRSREKRRSRSRSRDRGRKRSYSQGRRSSSPEYERMSNNKRHKHSSKKKAPTPPLLTTADLGDENWDEDCKEGYEPGYDPKVKLEADCILYNPMGLKKSERKKFRLENRKKAKIEIDELPAVDPKSDQPNNSSSSSSYKPPPMNDVKPVINNYKPAPTYAPPEESYPEAEEYPDYPEADYGPPHPGYGYGPPHHGYGPPPHMMPGYGPPHPHMGPPPPGYYGPPPPGYGPHPMMYGRPPMRPHFGPYGPPHPGMRPYPFYGRPRMPPPYEPAPYEPPPPMRPVHEVERVERVVERRYSSPSPKRDIKPNIKDLNIDELPEVTAPVLVKRDPDEPFEEGEIDEEGTRNDVKPSQTEDYDWNDDDD